MRRHGPAFSAAASILLLMTTAACSSAITGQPTGSGQASATSTGPSTHATSNASSASPTSRGSTGPSETLVLGTSRLGVHQFNLESGYDPEQIAQGVEFVLTSPEPSGYGYAPSEIGITKCPTSQPVVAGSSFDCTVDLGGNARTVVVSIVSNLGSYVVSKPR